MAKIPYNVSGVEEGAGGGEQPKPGILVAEIVSAEHRTENAQGGPADDIHVTLKYGGDYAWGHTYIGLGEGSEWKLAELVRALGLKDKGQIDTDKLKGKIIKVKINGDSYQGEYRGKVGRLMKAAPGDKILPAGSSNGASASTDGPDEEPEEVEVEATTANEDGEQLYREGTEVDGEVVGSYDEWPDGDLEAELTARGLEVVGGRGKKAKWVTALREDDASASGGGDGDGEVDAGSEDAADEYDSMDMEALEAEYSERELDLPTKPRGNNAVARYTKALIEGLRADDETDPFAG